MFVCTYTYMVVWVYTGEVNAKRLREAYLRAVLRQDIAYFDNVGAGEVATRIQTDTRASDVPFSSSTSTDTPIRQTWSSREPLRRWLLSLTSLLLSFAVSFSPTSAVGVLRSPCLRCSRVSPSRAV